jgi:uncharacterized membrane protein
VTAERGLYSVLAILHALAAATWLGAMVYSFAVLHPHARRYFAQETQFEAFIAAISHGARWPVLLAIALLAGTGGGLVALSRPQPHSPLWMGLVAAKVVALAAALSLFLYTSWRLWPARIFAALDEIPRFQRMFRRVAITMITLASLGTACGVLLHTLGLAP